MCTLVVVIILLPITKPIKILNFNSVSILNAGMQGLCDGAGACHLVRGSLKTWHVYIDVASPPSLAPHLNIFVIQHSFAPPWKHLFKPLSRHLFNGSSCHSNGRGDGGGKVE